jgi:hypothetical protein
MTDHRRLDEMLPVTEGDAGYTAGEDILESDVELGLVGEDTARVYPSTAIHPSELPRLPGRSRRSARSRPPVL